jgi:hypothetical protein
VSYIGNQPLYQQFLVDTFSGNGSTLAFTMTVAPANAASVLIAITGVIQDPSSYAVNGTTLTFFTAPPTGTNNISVRYLGIPASGVTTTAYRTVTNTTATAGQTSFTIPSYTVGYVDVYRNGVYLPTSDYTATTGTTVVLTNAATVGDTITTISFYVSSVLNAIPATAGSVSASYLAGGAARSNWGAGGVLQVQSTSLTSATSYSVASGATQAITGLSVSITPASTTSKIMVFVTANIICQNVGSSIQLLRGATPVGVGDAAGSRTQVSSGSVSAVQSLYSEMQAPSIQYLDSPATTSPITYSVNVLNTRGSTDTIYINRSIADTNASNFGRYMSSITVMEISA